MPVAATIGTIGVPMAPKETPTPLPIIAITTATSGL
jgi:hypothetical protein